MPKLLFSLFLITLFTSISAQQTSPDEALQRLIDGNHRFASDQSLHPDRTSERRKETAELQRPFATILGCSDSRVSPDIIFDQGIGDLFIVRVAGNVAGPIEFDSIDYSTLVLYSSIIVVLGHENCGAIKAVLDGQTSQIEAIAKLIRPAVKELNGKMEGSLENAVKANVKLVIEGLKKNKVLKKLIEDKKIKVVGGYYNFHSGLVEIL